MTGYQPLGKNVLLKPIKKDQLKQVKGIILPDSGKTAHQRAVVSCLGLGDHKFRVSVNDIVVYSGYSGFDLEVENEIYTIIPEESIMAIER